MKYLPPQEAPDRTVENTVDVKPAREKKSKAKVETKAETKAETGTDNEVKTEKKDEQKTETAQERKPREPQMVTANGEKVTHGHAYQSTTNPADWYFTAKIDGQQAQAAEDGCSRPCCLSEQGNDGAAADGTLLSDKADAEGI